MDIKDIKDIEKLASEFEEELGLDAQGDNLIDKAEENVEAKKEAENLGVTIEKNIEEEKKNTPVPESSLEASETEAATIASEEAPFDDDVAKRFQANLKKLTRIAQTVKMSKDLPACKKEEVLGKIQTATEKLIDAAKKGGKKEETEDKKKEDITKNTLRTKQTPNAIDLKKGMTQSLISKLRSNPSATMAKIFENVGKKMKLNMPVSSMSAKLFIALIQELENIAPDIK